MRKFEAKRIALGGLLAALAIVIMCLGGMIPIATFICPGFCIILCDVVLRLCGKRIAWAWYVAVSFLCIMFGPDKEAALVYCFMGYYPMIKSIFERTKLSWLFKLTLFNAAVFLMYGLVIRLLGMDQVISEFSEMGSVLLVVTLLLGNITFVMIDFMLNRTGLLMKMIRKK